MSQTATSARLIPGHIEKLGPDLYQVHGNTAIYTVNAAESSCNCLHWVHRCSRTRADCRHLAWLRAALEGEARCPACLGIGALVPRGGPYASGNDPLACVVCCGTGKRADADPRLAAVADAYRAEQANADLLDLFR